MEKADENQVQRIGLLETKLKVLGVLTVIAGLGQFYYASTIPLSLLTGIFIITGLLTIILGAFLIS